MKLSVLRWPLRLVLLTGVAAVAKKLRSGRRDGTADPINGDPWPAMADPKVTAAAASPAAAPSPRPAPAGDPLAAAASTPTTQATQATQASVTPSASEEAAVHRPAQPAEGSARSWVDPLDGVCPSTHPVKVNIDSGVFHVEGSLSYERMKAQRCYRSPDAAEADGFRRAER